MTHQILSSILILSSVIYFVNSDTIKVETKGGNDWWYYVQVKPEGTRTDTTVAIESEDVFISLESDGWAYATEPLSAQLVLPLGIKLIRGGEEIYVPNLITDYEAGKIFDLDLDFDTTTSAPVTTTSASITTTSAPITTTSAPITTTSAPITTTSTPVDTTSVPTDTTSTPTDTTSVPTETTSTPTDTISTPVDPDTIKINIRGNSWWCAVEVLPEITRTDTTVEIESAGEPGVFITLTRHSWAYATEPLSTELVLPLGIRLTRDAAGTIYVPDIGVTEFDLDSTTFDLGVNFGTLVPTPPSSPPSSAPTTSTLSPTRQTQAPTPAPTQPTQSPIPTITPPERNPRDYRISTVSGCGVGKRVALTFDDGPAGVNGETVAILDALDTRGIKGTFFVSPASWGDDQTGLDRRCALIEEIVNRGHEIQSHGWRHPDFTTLDNAGIMYELDTVNDFIFNCGGVRPTMFRPPYGSLNKDQAEFIVATYGYVIALWNLDSNDWRDPNNAQFITAELNLDEYTESSINVLFHDRSSYAVIDDIINTFENANYEFILGSECWNECDDSCFDADGVCMDYTRHSGDTNWFFHNQQVLLENSWNTWRN